MNDDGTFKVNFNKMQEAMNNLSDKILTIQGDGDYNAAKKLMEEMGVVNPDLEMALEQVNKAGIPRDIVFEQGPEVIGL